MNPWLLFVGPIIMVVFPWTIPFLLGAAAWQLTRGGERIGVAVLARARTATSGPTRIAATKAARGPLPVYDDAREGYFDICLLCGETVGWVDPLGWRHTDPDDTCWEPPAMDTDDDKEADDG